MKLNIENARKWAAELRSGKYKQAREAMSKDGGFCCLGVAHECLIGPVPPDAEGGTSNAYGKVDDALGFSDWNGTSRDVFVHMNDEEGATFEEIAGYIDGLIETAVLEEG